MIDEDKNVDFEIWEKAGAECWANSFQYNFRETRNPYFVWEAIRLSAAAGIPVPDWTAPYLWESARKLMSGIEPQNALGLKVGRGKVPLLAQFNNALLHDQIGLAVEERIDALLKIYRRGVKDSAYQQIAVENDVTPKQAQKWYEEWLEKSAPRT